MSDSYPILSLAQVCDLITDGSHFSPLSQPDGHVIVNAKDIPRGRIQLETCTRISTRDWELLKSQNCAPVPGDVLLSKDGTIGRVVNYESDLGVVTLSSIAILRPGDAVRPAYLSQVLRSHFFDQQVVTIQSGSALRRIILRDIRSLHFPFPPLQDQETIATILSTIDQAIEQTEAIIAKQQRIKTGLMQDLLTRGIDEHGNLRSEETHEFKDSPLGRIPVEWEVVPVGELLASVDPSMRSGPFGSALLKEELVSAGVPLLGIDNVHIERFVPVYQRFVTPDKAKQLGRYRVRARDVMITIMGTVGRCCVVPEDIGEAISSKHVWTLSFNQERYSSELACIQFDFAPWVLARFSRDEQGGIMSAIRSDTLRTTPFILPSFDEIGRINSVFSAVSAAISDANAVVGKLRRKKTALMQDLLTGKKRVTPLLETEAH